MGGGIVGVVGGVESWVTAVTAPKEIVGAWFVALVWLAEALPVFGSPDIVPAVVIERTRSASTTNLMFLKDYPLVRTTSCSSRPRIYALRFSSILAGSQFEHVQFSCMW